MKTADMTGAAREERAPRRAAHAKIQEAHSENRVRTAGGRPVFTRVLDCGVLDAGVLDKRRR